MPKPSKQRTLNKFIRIFTEGAVTEVKYFQGIIKESTALKAAEVKQANDYSPKGLVAAAIQAKKEAKKNGIAETDTHIWVVFDKDEHAGIEDAIKQAQANNIGVAFSNICFELWVLLHYTYSTAPHKPCDSLIKKIKEHNPNYSKERAYDVYTVLAPKINTALSNGNRLRDDVLENNPNTSYWEINPYTDVQHLVEFLLSVH